MMSSRPMPLRLINRMGADNFLRYGAASAVALGADVGSFLLLLRAGMPAMPASATSYALGIVVHWLISSRLVFANALAATGPERRRQQLLFVGSALVGLALTAWVVGFAVSAGIDPRLAKPVAVGLSFLVTWVLRNRVVFGDMAPPR